METAKPRMMGTGRPRVMETRRAQLMETRRPQVTETTRSQGMDTRRPDAEVEATLRQLDVLGGLLLEGDVKGTAKKEEGEIKASAKSNSCNILQNTTQQLPATTQQSPAPPPPEPQCCWEWETAWREDEILAQGSEVPIIHL